MGMSTALSSIGSGMQTVQGQDAQVQQQFGRESTPKDAGLSNESIAMTNQMFSDVKNAVADFRHASRMGKALEQNQVRQTNFGIVQSAFEQQNWFDRLARRERLVNRLTEASTPEAIESRARGFPSFEQTAQGIAEQGQVSGASPSDVNRIVSSGVSSTRLDRLNRGSRALARDRRQITMEEGMQAQDAQSQIMRLQETMDALQRIDPLLSQLNFAEVDRASALDDAIVGFLPFVESEGQ